MWRIEAENKPGILIKNVAEILVRDGCDLNYNFSSKGKDKLINSRDT